MPRFFAQAQQQVLADRRKEFVVPETVVKTTVVKETTVPAASLPNGLQGAIAQMESNAAAAVARFKSFRAGAVKDEPEASQQSEMVDEIPDSPGGAQRYDSGTPETFAEHAQASRLAALETAAARYLAADRDGTPWHHSLKGTQWGWLSGILDHPLALLVAALAFLTAGCWQQLMAILQSCLTVQRMSMVLGACCLLLAVSGWLIRTAAFLHSQMSAFADTVPRMPVACQEMTQMLEEMRLMRHDLKSMKAKVAWLPGGE